MNTVQFQPGHTNDQAKLKSYRHLRAKLKHVLLLGYLRASLSNFHKMPSNVCLWCCYFCRWATFVICLMTYMNEIALLGFFLHVKCWYRMFCVALFFEIHLTSAYFGRNLSFDIFFLISMEPFWIESTVSPEIVCIMFF